MAAKAKRVKSTKNTLHVELDDGRILSVPLEWYPRLLHATPRERNNWHLLGDGAGIHWPDLDEDIGVDNLLAGRASGESHRSFQRWLKKRMEQQGPFSH